MADDTKDRRDPSSRESKPTLSKLVERGDVAADTINSEEDANEPSDQFPRRSGSEADPEDAQYFADEDDGTDFDVHSMDFTLRPRDPSTALDPDLPEEFLDPDPSTAHLASADGVADEASVPENAPPRAEGDPPASREQGRARNIVGVAFTEAGRSFPYDSGTLRFAIDDTVIVESPTGPRIGKIVVSANRKAIARKKVKRVLRKATSADLHKQGVTDQNTAKILENARLKAKNEFENIHIFKAEQSTAGNHLLLYATAGEEIDAAELLRLLAIPYEGTVEIRQVGVRDQAKMVGGIGSCGQTLCCTTWLPKFAPVSIRHAKDQGLALNPSKISGQCGRLKCCLVYEHKTYAALKKNLPKAGKQVITDNGDEGKVLEVDILHQQVRVGFGRGQSKLIPASRLRRGTPQQKPSAPVTPAGPEKAEKSN